MFSRFLGSSVLILAKCFLSGLRRKKEATTNYDVPVHPSPAHKKFHRASHGLFSSPHPQPFGKGGQEANYMRHDAPSEPFLRLLGGNSGFTAMQKSVDPQVASFYSVNAYCTW
ncbi:hypothetical protein H4582DRAFT_521597 [Lactarius indigo]|nr:hypothetical protein H4582DRAFT_521597 [Lactarius indigo]